MFTLQLPIIMLTIPPEPCFSGRTYPGMQLCTTSMGNNPADCGLMAEGWCLYMDGCTYIRRPFVILQHVMYQIDYKNSHLILLNSRIEINSMIRINRFIMVLWENISRIAAVWWIYGKASPWLEVDGRGVMFLHEWMHMYQGILLLT